MHESSYGSHWLPHTLYLFMMWYYSLQEIKIISFQQHTLNYTKCQDCCKWTSYWYIHSTDDRYWLCVFDGDSLISTLGVNIFPFIGADGDLLRYFAVSVFKSLTLKTIHGRHIFRTWRESERIIADGRVDVQKIITHRFPMSQFEEAYSVLFAGIAIKVVLDPWK